jgi:hypothetical protein
VSKDSENRGKKNITNCAKSNENQERKNFHISRKKMRENFIKSKLNNNE